MSNFSEISKKYEKDSVVQKSASEILFDLLEIQPKDDVLGLGCGTGHISRLIRNKTRGKVVGVDPSDGMIEKAEEKFSSLLPILGFFKTKQGNMQNYSRAPGSELKNQL